MKEAPPQRANGKPTCRRPRGTTSLQLQPPHGHSGESFSFLRTLGRGVLHLPLNVDTPARLRIVHKTRSVFDSPYISSAVQLSERGLNVLLNIVGVFGEGVPHTVPVNGVDVVRRPDVGVIVCTAASHPTLTGHLAQSIHDPTGDH